MYNYKGSDLTLCVICVYSTTVALYYSYSFRCSAEHENMTIKFSDIDSSPLRRIVRPPRAVVVNVNK